MIVANLKHSDRIEPLHPLFKAAFDYVKSHDMLHTPGGRIELDGRNLFINCDNPTLKTAGEQVLEAHRKYIDIHIPLDGDETIGWKNIDDCSNESRPYDTEADCQFFAEPASAYVTLHPGEFLVAWPEDAHAPIIGSGSLRKLIVKVRI